MWTVSSAISIITLNRQMYAHCLAIPPRFIDRKTEKTANKKIPHAGFFMLRKILTPWFIFSCLCSTQLSRFEFTALQFSLLQMLQCPACDGAVNGYIRTEIEDIDLADVISAQARIFR